MCSAFLNYFNYKWKIKYKYKQSTIKLSKFIKFKFFAKFCLIFDYYQLYEVMGPQLPNCTMFISQDYAYASGF